MSIGCDCCPLVVAEREKRILAQGMADMARRFAEYHLGIGSRVPESTERIMAEMVRDAANRILPKEKSDA